ncbi:MAG: sulfatase [Planctomycetota bacterium]|nr:MAG: sulfatase [Planctomycetota bacterium]
MLRALLLAVAEFATWTFMGIDARAAEKPNIIFILADDLGYGDLSCYGQKNFQTPCLDRMAAEGLRFTQHYAGSTVCAPSRACLLAGQHTGHVYQRANGNIAFRPDPQDISVARLLKNARYHTALIGKSGLSCRTEDGSHPNKKGFDHFFGYVDHGAAHRYYPKWLWRNGERVRYANNDGFEGDSYSPDLFLEDALRYVESHRDGPFFLHLSMTQPHADLNVPAKWKEPFLGKFQEVPFPGNHYRPEPNPKATFAGMIAHLDHAVGQVLGKLRELGIEENTLVLFSSDNGGMSEGGWSRDYFDSNGPLRGGKRDLYEGGIRVPLIAWWPQHIAAGETTDHVSAFWDFVPTACEIAGAATPADTDGISYAPTLLGRSNEQKRHDYLYWEFYEQGGKQAVRQGDWKGVRLDVQTAYEGPIELYHLGDDLGEKHNVAGDHPEIVERMSAIMREAHVDSQRFKFVKE